MENNQRSIDSWQLVLKTQFKETNYRNNEDVAAVPLRAGSACTRGWRNMDRLIKEKFERLREIFQSMEKVVVAYSGGVDSTLLLKTATETLGDGGVIAVTALSPLYPERELAAAMKMAETLKVRHVLIESNELEIAEFVKNPSNRCYFCKKKLFGELLNIAKEESIPFVVEGSTVDDDQDYRPGRIAVAELGIRSPLREALLTKSEVRELSRMLNLKTWDKPSFACLASRFPYGEEINQDGLRMVDEAEDFLFGLGFKQVRVRHYQTLARIEILQGEMGRLLDGSLREKVVSELKRIGYKYVTLDLQGFRSGSMNEVLG